MTHQPLDITLAKHLGFIPAIFIGLSMESFAILAVFMIIDTIAGVARTMIVDGCRSFKSIKLASGITAKSLLILIPLLIAWAGRGAGLDLIFIAQGVMGLLIFSELYSIIGNLYAIRVRKNVPEWDAVNFVLLRLQKIIEHLIKNGSNRN